MKIQKKPASPLLDLYRLSACQANQIAAGIYSATTTQLGTELQGHLASGNFEPIVSASVNPLDYTNADTFSRDYLCAELMSKYPHWDIGIDRSAVALRKFAEVEAHLATLNFSKHHGIVSHLKGVSMRAIEMSARTRISKMLGEFSWNEAHAFFAFGPGASTSLPRTRSDAAFKFGAQRPQLSYNAEPLASALNKAHPTWLFEAEVVAGSRLVTVPKNAKTDRAICIEPDLNMYFQKGIGKMIRRRLQRWGLLRSDAQQYNARLALEGSANGRLATVDLSSASDSIHIELVRLLLPPDWVAAIEQSRSPYTVLPSGEVHLLRKVSSMGNGFTFELETLIFYALCQAIIEYFADRETDRQCTVFGDDIIIASELVPPLIEALSFFGFSTNTKKTFWTGKFRESCGKHYFAGTDVTPFYIRDRIDSVHRKYWAANMVRRYSRLHPWGLDSRYKPVYDGIVDSIPSFFRSFKIPEGVGDGGLVVDWDEASPSRAPHGLDAWSYQDVIPRFGKKRLGGSGALLKSLHLLELPIDPETKRIIQNRVPYLLENGLMSAIKQKVQDPRKISWEMEYCFGDEGGDPLMRHGDQSPSNGEMLASAFKATAKKQMPSVLPKPQGFKVHKGTAQRWPSFGPWV